MQNQAAAKKLREPNVLEAVSAKTNGKGEAAYEVSLPEGKLPPQVLERRLRQCERVVGYSRLKAARYLLEFDERELWRRLGFSSTVHYASVVLGLCQREVWERLRVARGLRALPYLREAVASGRISWSKARELVRVVRREDEVKWVEWAAGASYRQVEGRVGESVRGEEEECAGMSVKIARAGKVRVTVELTTGEFALLDQAMRRAREEIKSERVAEQLVHVAKCYLGGGSRDGRKMGLPVRLVVHRCFECGRVWQETSKGAVAVEEPREVDEVVDLREESGEAVVGGGEKGRSVSSVNRSHRASESSRAGSSERERSRWIPSRTRQVVKDRDGGRCQVEGCENWKWTEAHHVKFFSKGGRHQLGNLLTLCSEHHRQLHEGTLELLKDPARILGFK